MAANAGLEQVGVASGLTNQEQQFYALCALAKGAGATISTPTLQWRAGWNSSAWVPHDALFDVKVCVRASSAGVEPSSQVLAWHRAAERSLVPPLARVAPGVKIQGGFLKVPFEPEVDVSYTV